ncbi:MAG: glycerophosphodiester phosphodiesterase family protein [Hyphomicrobiales bacterium]
MQALKVLGTFWRPLIIFSLLFRLLTFLVLAPLTTFAITSLVHSSGHLTLTNSDIAGFLLSVPGGLLLVLFLVTFVASFFIEQGGYMLLVQSARAGYGTHLAQLFFELAQALPRLLMTAFWVIAIVLAWLVPIFAAAGFGYVTLLGAHDINWYLAQRPPEFLTAVAFGGVLAVCALALTSFLVVRWSLAVPVSFYEGVKGKNALKRSSELVRGNAHRVAAAVLGWLTLMTLIAGLGAIISDVFAGGLLNLITKVNVLVVLMALLVGVATLLSFAMTFVSFSGYAVITQILYEDLGGQGVPKVHKSTAATPVRFGYGAAGLALLAGVAISWFVIDGLVDDLTLSRDVQITAHRGSSASAPENTLSALRQAISDGADYAEIDVQETADGEIVLLHDSDLLRVAGVPDKIWETKLKRLAQLEAGAWFSEEFRGEPIPTLKQAIDLVRGKIRLNIELKYNGHDKELARRVVDIVRAEKFVSESFIASLEAGSLAQVHELAPEIKTGQIVTAAIGKPENLPVQILSMNKTLASSIQVRRNRAAHRETHVWTINSTQEMLTMLDRGVDNIITDHPKQLKTILDERAKLSNLEILLLALSRKVRE